MPIATFYPINTPLVNYFFYKAPFITDNYVLTNLSLISAGSSYNVDDVIVMGGGTYSSPAVIKVTSVLESTITGFVITNSGQYTSPTPSSFIQASTSGSGTGATFGSLTFAPNLLPPGPNIPLTGGFIYFYADEDHTLQLPTYSDISDPENPVVNTNPVQLGAAGEMPLFYLEDRLYYIVITDYTADQASPQITINHYNPSQSGSIIGTPYIDNFFTNPQFNYPIEFWTLNEGEITEPVTVVAWSWYFLQDVNTLTSNNITFIDISSEGIEGNPTNEFILNSDDVSSSETLKDVRQIMGVVNFFEGQQVTFCAQMENRLSGNLQVDILLELYYGIGGSPTQVIPLTSLIVIPTLQKYVFTFTVPPITGMTIGQDNHFAIRIRPGIGAVCQFGMTNLMFLDGDVPLPVFSQQPKSFEKSQILGNATDIQFSGIAENYSSYMYVNGVIDPYADTGAILLCPNGSSQPFRQVCDGSSLLVNGFNQYNIPYSRLFKVIGTEFGSAGTLVASVNNNIVSVSSVLGAREHSAWTAGDTTFTVTRTVMGLKYGLNAVVTGALQVTMTYFVQFTVPQTPVSVLGYSPPSGLFSFWTFNGPYNNSIAVTSTTINAGSPTANAVAQLNFSSINPPTTLPRPDQPSPWQRFSGGIIDYCGDGSTRGTYNAGIGVFQPSGLFTFLSDGNGNQAFVASPVGQNPVINFLSTNTYQQNLQLFCTTIANPFTWQVTVNSAPTASQYFLYSDGTTDYYLWFTVNGVGTDPAIAGRTGVVCATFTGNSPDIIAEIIADTLNTAEFSVPATSDLPALVGSSKVSWFINL